LNLLHVIGRVNLLEAVVKFDASLSDDISVIKQQSTSSVETFFLLNKLLPFELQWKFTPLSSIADCSITLTENALIDMLKDLCPSVKDQVEDVTKEHKGVLISQLFGYRFGAARSKKLCLVSDNNRKQYVLSNSVIISGPSLSVIVIDTFSKKKPESINTAAENEVVDLEGF
jgi:hypothetical protein